MSFRISAIPAIPEETARIAHQAFPKGSIVMSLRDQLGSLYEDQHFQALFPSTQGQPAWSAWRLALITVMQYIEDMSDIQAAQAVRGRIDWKYALSLALSDPGIDASVLSEFRNRLICAGKEAVLLERLLEECQHRGWLGSGGKQRSDSTHVVAAIRRLHRLEVIGETLRAALNSLAVAVPEWLQATVPVEWFERYGSRIEDYRFPKSAKARKQLAQTMGTPCLDTAVLHQCRPRGAVALNPRYSPGKHFNSFPLRYRSPFRHQTPNSMGWLQSSSE